MNDAPEASTAEEPKRTLAAHGRARVNSMLEHVTAEARAFPVDHSKPPKKRITAVASAAHGLPTKTLRTIMKSNPTVSMVGAETKFLMPVAVRLFVSELALLTHAKAKERGGENGDVEDVDVAAVLTDNCNFKYRFLRDLIREPAPVSDAVAEASDDRSDPIGALPCPKRARTTP